MKSPPLPTVNRDSQSEPTGKTIGYATAEVVCPGGQTYHGRRIRPKDHH